VFIGNDKISKTVNDSDSDGGNVIEFFWWHVQSKFTVQQKQQQ
jgi:hypothetical protein